MKAHTRVRDYAADIHPRLLRDLGVEAAFKTLSLLLIIAPVASYTPEASSSNQPFLCLATALQSVSAHASA